MNNIDKYLQKKGSGSHIRYYCVLNSWLKRDKELLEAFKRYFGNSFESDLISYIEDDEKKSIDSVQDIKDLKRRFYIAFTLDVAKS